MRIAKPGLGIDKRFFVFPAVENDGGGSTKGIPVGAVNPKTPREGSASAIGAVPTESSFPVKYSGKLRPSKGAIMDPGPFLHLLKLSVLSLG